MICCICGKKQSALFGGFPLSDDATELRICAQCYSKKTEMLVSVDSDKYTQARNEFVGMLQPSVSQEIREAFENMLKPIDERHQKWENDMRAAREKEEEEQKLEYQKRILLDNMIMTTSYNIEGYHITKYIKVISGESVMGTGFLSEFSAGISDFFGVENETFAKKLETAKESAGTKIAEKAVELGADAVIGVSYSYTMFSDNMIGVIVTGTAVKISE